jgi:hypothetical protein
MREESGPAERLYYMEIVNLLYRADSFLETDCPSASQEISHILMNPKFHYQRGPRPHILFP